MVVAIFLLSALAVYGAFGTLFALAFVFIGVGKVDATARGATPGFRLIIIPGAILLWPILLRKWLTAVKKETP
jgi:hypothetical protein